MGTFNRALSYYGTNGERLDVHLDGGFGKLTEINGENVSSSDGEAFDMVFEFCNRVLKDFNPNAFACCGEPEECDKDCENANGVD